MLILFFLLLFILLLFPEAAAQGSKNGLILWATVLVPSLLHSHLSYPTIYER